MSARYYDIQERMDDLEVKLDDILAQLQLQQQQQQQYQGQYQDQYQDQYQGQYQGQTDTDIVKLKNIGNPEIKIYNENYNILAIIFAFLFFRNDPEVAVASEGYAEMVSLLKELRN